MKMPLSLLVAALLAAAALTAAQDQTFLQQAQKQDLVDVQFFADANFQMVHTPWAYYDFQPIQVGTCTACTDFQVRRALAGNSCTVFTETAQILLPHGKPLHAIPWLEPAGGLLSDMQASARGELKKGMAMPQGAPVTWGSAMVASSPTGGELLHMFSAPGCTGTPLNTGGRAPTLPASYAAASFMICRTSS